MARRNYIHVDPDSSRIASMGNIAVGCHTNVTLKRNMTKGCPYRRLCAVLCLYCFCCNGTGFDAYI